MNDELGMILEHRRKKHPLRLVTQETEAQILCYKCRDVLMAGERAEIREIYESVLQHPQRRSR
jgi:hypothetical protein